MLFDWSAECAADDPVLVVPWSTESAPSNLANSPASGPQNPSASAIPQHLHLSSRFIDLREDAYAAEEIPEADLHPPLLHALRALNASRSPLFTAKCDAWIIDAPEVLADLRLNLDLTPDDTRTGFASYIDLLWRDRTIFASFHQYEHLAHRLARRAAPLDHPFALLDCVIRPAFLDLTGPQEGFALTLYVKAVGPDQHASLENWGAALESAVALLRSKDLTPNT